MNIPYARLFRFVLVGAVNTLLDWVVLNLEILAFGNRGGLFSYPVYKAVSFSVAVINSYVFNKRWVFRSETENRRALPSFALVSAIGLGVNVLAASAVMTVSLCSAHFVLCANLGAVAGSWAAFVWNYVGYAVFVFKQ